MYEALDPQSIHMHLICDWFLELYKEIYRAANLRPHGQIKEHQQQKVCFLVTNIY